ncbi:MAG TPA: hypothetical protein VJW51_03600 [Candidatus Acidoferrales bacterium]|nr:hypothetical protein [Candidatus Acidoferrales bacterium]
MRTLLAHPISPILGAAAALLLVAAALWWWRHRPRDPEEMERRRREYLSRVGRIVEGEILEILESPAHTSAESRGKRGAKGAPASNGNGIRSLVCYTYAISGVTYETAQDVTGFEERACLKQLIMGQPASVKYDPQSPGNSMLIAEDWSGL